LSYIFMYIYMNTNMYIHIYSVCTCM